MNCRGFSRIILLLALGSARPAPAIPDLSDLLDRVRESLPRQEILRGPAPVTWPGGVQGETVVFRQTTWELKDPPQSAAVSGRMQTEAMNLPQSERLKRMNRIEDHMQMWFVSLTRYPQAGAGLKARLQPLSLTNRFFRETAFLGQKDGWACYAYMPIYHWIYLQKKLELQGGDDPIPAAARGLTIHDQGGMTANSMEWILAKAGLRALPHLERVVQTTNYSRALRVLGLIPGKESTRLLEKYCSSPNPNIAKAARNSLIYYPHPEAGELYFHWLNEDAGNVPVYRLLMTCAEVNEARLGSFLPRILARPRSRQEFRHAFELSRTLEGQPIPKALLQAEKDIKTYGYKSGENYAPEKVDAAAAILAQSEDIEAAAQIAVTLACATTKGDWTPANLAGLAVLKQLPGNRGVETARLLYLHCDDDWVSGQLQSLFEAKE